jgi:hypothetical protein
MTERGILVGAPQNEDFLVELKYLEKANPSANFLTTNSTWTVILNQTFAKKNYHSLYRQLI